MRKRRLSRDFSRSDRATAYPLKSAGNRLTLARTGAQLARTPSVDVVIGRPRAWPRLVARSKPRSRWASFSSAIRRLAYSLRVSEISRADPDCSTVYVFGELEPQELALFNADEVLTAPGDPSSARVEALGHGIGYWFAGCPREEAFEASVAGQRILRLTVAIYAALGGEAFQFTLRNWLEARGVVGYATVMGFSSRRFGVVELTRPDAAVNRVLREAVEVATIVDQATPAHRLALFDLHTARSERGIDSILYAYRAVEAIRQSISPGPGSHRTWRAMHDRLGTDEEPLKELERIASAIRHADHDDPQVAAAQEESALDDLLNRANDAVLRELERLAGRDLLTLRAAA